MFSDLPVPKWLKSVGLTIQWHRINTLHRLAALIQCTNKACRPYCTQYCHVKSLQVGTEEVHLHPLQTCLQSHYMVPTGVVQTSSIDTAQQ